MSLSNYPPGVTGNEFQIAGPDWDREEERYCPMCEKVQPGLAEGYRHDSWWMCALCFTVVDDEHEEDPDRDRDLGDLVE